MTDNDRDPEGEAIDWAIATLSEFNDVPASNDDNDDDGGDDDSDES